MRDSELGVFSDMLSDVAALYGKTLSTTQIAMWFRLMAGFTIEQVQGAFDAHARDATTGRFMPLPADLLAKLETAAAIDGRPSPEEAWSTAIQAMDEAVTVVWTTETAQAWAEVGQALMEAGDRFNASRGFISRYQELVRVARKGHFQARWVVSQGHDKDLRHSALESAYRAGRISREICVQMLPRHQDAGPIVAAIAGKVVPLLGVRRADSPDRAAEIKLASERLAQLAETLKQGDKPVDRRPTVEQGKRIVMQAVEAGVLTTVREIDDWMTRAGSREDVSELQVRMLGERRHA